MKGLGFWLNATLNGRVALGVAIGSATIALGLVTSQLSWSRWPNLLAVVLSSWLYLLVVWAIAASAVQSVVRGKAVFSEMLGCIGFGLIWGSVVGFIPIPIPFNVGHYVMVYGFTGLAAACLRRSRQGTSRAGWIPKSEVQRDDASAK